jgi:hypothetical protein
MVPFTLVLLAALFAAGGAAWAQVASPSLAPFGDGATANPSAMQWHESSVIGLIAGSGSGDILDPSGTSLAEGENHSRTVNLRLHSASVSFGMDARRTTLEFASPDHLTFVNNREETVTRVAAALQLGGLLALGIGREHGRIESTFRIGPPLTNGALPPFNGAILESTGETTATLPLAGVSLRLGEVLYLGAAGGTETVQVMQNDLLTPATPPPFASTEDFEVERDVRRYGAGIRWRPSAGNAVRVEGSLERRDPFQRPGATVQEDESETRSGTLEVMVNHVLFAFNGNTTQRFVDGEKTEESRGSLTAIAWVPDDGFSLAVGASHGEVEPVASPFGVKRLEFDDWAVAVAWIY